MGNKSSNPLSGKELSGFRITRVEPGSPGEAAGLTVGSDFLLSVNGHNLSKMSVTSIRNYMISHENRTITFKVFNANLRQLREVTLRPSKKWSANLKSGPGHHLIGLNMRLDIILKPHDHPNINYEDVYPQASSPDASGGFQRSRNLAGTNGSVPPTTNEKTPTRNTHLNTPSENLGFRHSSFTLGNSMNRL